jgi:hypothetical protein
VAAVALVALLIPLLAGRASSATSLAYVFNGSQGLRAAAVLSQPTYLPGKSVGLVNSVESTAWEVLPYWQNGQLVLNTSVASVVITINNAQASATPAPFDQFINITLQQVESVLGTTVGSYLWSQAKSNDFLDVLFVNSSGKPLYAWVQNFTSSWVAFWVKLPNGVPANGAVNITMEFTPSSQYPYIGLAPYLTSTYGQYDNGQYVFPVYYNFAGTSLPQGLVFTVLSNPSGASGSYTVSNSLNVTNVKGADFWNSYFMISLVYINKTINFTATPLLFETIVKGIGGSALSSDSGWSKAGLVYMNSLTTSSTSNGEADMLVTNGNGYAVQWQSGTSYIAPSANWNGGSISYPTVLAMLLSGSYATGFYGSSLNNLVKPTSAVSPSGYKGVGYVGLWDTAHTTSGTFWADFQLLLARPWPPNGVMPTATVVGGYPVGQYLAWRYTPTSNTVNITLHVTSYPINTANTVGVALYSSNIGNLQSDSSGSFYGLLISFNGSVLYHAPGSSYKSLKSSAFPTPKAPFTMTVLLTQSSGNVSVSYVYINGTAYAVNLVTPMPWTDIGYVGLRASPGNSLYVSYFGVSPSPFGGVEDFINSVESTSGWSTLPYLANGQLVFSSPGAGDYIAWGYVPISNTLNVTIRLSKATVPSGTNSSIFLASSGLGNTGSIYSSSGYYYLGVSLFDNSSSNGIITFKGTSQTSLTVIYSGGPLPNPSYPSTFTVIFAENASGYVVVQTIYINGTAYQVNKATPFPWGQISYVGIELGKNDNFNVTYMAVSPVYLGPYFAMSRLYLTSASSMSWGAVAWQAYYNGNSNLTVSLVGTYTLGSSPPGDLDIGLFLTPTGWGINPQSNSSVPIAPASLSVLGAAPALMSSTNYLLVAWSPYFAYEGLSYDTRAALVYFNGSTSMGVIKYYNGSAKVGVPSSGNLINFTVTYVPASGELVVLVKNLNTGASEKDIFSVGFTAGAGWYAFFVGAGNGLDYANWQVLNITVAGASVVAVGSTSTVTVVTTFNSTTVSTTFVSSKNYTTPTTISTSTTGAAIVTVTSLTTRLVRTNTTVVGTTTTVGYTTNLVTAPSITTTSYTTNGLLSLTGTSVTSITLNTSTSPLTVIFTGAYASITPSTLTERSFSVNYTTLTPYATALTYVFNSTTVTFITNSTTVIYNTSMLYTTTLYPTTYINITGVITFTTTTVTSTLYTTLNVTTSSTITTSYNATAVVSTTSSISRSTTTTHSTSVIGSSIITITSYTATSTVVSSTATQVITNTTTNTLTGTATVLTSTAVVSTTNVTKALSSANLTATTETISGTSTAVTTSPTVVTTTINSTTVTTIYSITKSTTSYFTVYVNTTTTTKYTISLITNTTVYEYINVTGVATFTSTTVTQTVYTTLHATTNVTVTSSHNTTVIDTFTSYTSGNTTTTINRTTIGSSIVTVISYTSTSTVLSSTVTAVTTVSTTSTSTGTATISNITAIVSTTNVVRTLSTANLTATTETISGTSTAVTTSPTAVVFTTNTTEVTATYSVTEDTMSHFTVYVNTTTTTEYTISVITNTTVYEYINVTNIVTATNTSVTQTFYVTQYETSNGMVTTYYSTTVVESTTLSTSSRTTTTNSTTVINGASLATLTSYGTVTTKVSSTATQVIVNSTVSTVSVVSTVSTSTTTISTTTVGRTVSTTTLTASTVTISGTSTAVTTSPTAVVFTTNTTGVTTIYTVTEETISGGKVYVNETTTTRYVTYDITDITVYENITTVMPTYGVYANGYGFYIVISTPAPVKYLSYMVYAYFANYSQMVVVASPLYTSVTGNYTLVVGYNLTSGVQHIILSTVLTNQTLSTTITVNATPTVYFGQQRFDPILWVVTPPAQLPSLNSDYLIDATILFVAAVAGAFMFHSNRRDAALGLVAFALFATFILSLTSAPLFAYASLAGFLAVIGAVILVIVERNREA